MLKPSQTLAGRFTISDPDASGALADADSLPTGALLEDGVVDAAVTVTVSNVSTGIYSYSCTIPADYTAGTNVQVQISGVLNTNNVAGIVFSDHVDLYWNSNLAGSGYSEGTHALGLVAGTADMADAVLDELITGHDTSDSVGAAFTTILASSSLTVSEIADGVLDELVTEHTDANSLGSVVRSRYWAKLVFVPGDTTDQYRSIRWYKGDDPLDSGVTTPLIRVISADTGTDLIAETALSEAGTSHLYLYDATDTELTTAGKAYTVRMKATIDSAVRTFEGGIVKPAASS